MCSSSLCHNEKCKMYVIKLSKVATKINLVISVLTSCWPPQAAVDSKSWQYFSYSSMEWMDKIIHSNSCHKILKYSVINYFSIKVWLQAGLHLYLLNFKNCWINCRCSIPSRQGHKNSSKITCTETNEGFLRKMQNCSYAVLLAQPILHLSFHPTYILWIWEYSCEKLWFCAISQKSHCREWFAW